MDCEKKLYAIREVSEITGVKPVTLRAWQRRYSLVQPQRTEKGHRLYTDQHIALIGEIQSWLSKGVPIGKVKAILGSNTDSGAETLTTRFQLEEVATFLQALADLNKGKADSIVSTVLKEYPLDVVESQFLQPAEKALSLVRFGLRSIQKGMMDAILFARLSSIIEAENKAARAGRCLFISYDSVNDIGSRLWAMKLSELGMSIVIIDGVDDLSGLIEHHGLNSYHALALYSSRPLNAAQGAIVERIQECFTGKVLLSELIENERVE
ncbi:MerR family transcriptional regulator [Vibrio sp. JPW-9-11-11]|uniref:MerR family transcriptional regulator n=1 Tax=Vibrio sp. JPW-9-11-11 TaxID=1416532 RepID=UPI0015947AE7|nr:MerR family transcriptional regulator [Vibrio sp. JPW-9-11-11]NVD08847.1 MerR family transcriptional regulator [Vibrio sp. JPW-9-11-11]